MADCSKNIAVKVKNQVYDPMKLFVDNYQTLNNQQVQKLKQKQLELVERYNDMTKNKQNYLNASEKLEKNRKIQGKSMVKIENGDLEELEKYIYS